MGSLNGEFWRCLICASKPMLCAPCEHNQRLIRNLKEQIERLEKRKRRNRRPDIYPHELARSGDPDTSHMAAEAVTPKLTEIEQWALERVRLTPGLTQFELGYEHSRDNNRKPGRRMSELERLGLVRQGLKRKCTMTKCMAYTWWPVAEGEETTDPEVPLD